MDEWKNIEMEKEERDSSPRFVYASASLKLSTGTRLSTPGSYMRRNVDSLHSKKRSDGLRIYNLSWKRKEMLKQNLLSSEEVWKSF